MSANGLWHETFAQESSVTDTFPGLAPPLHCEDCHPTAGYTVGHKNGAVDWNFGVGRVHPYATTGSYVTTGRTPLVPTDNTPAHGLYGQCQNVYCHSTGQSSPPGGAPTYASPTWGNVASGRCGTCHPTGPGDSMYGAGPSIATGSHLVHVDNTATQYMIACVTCHSDDPTTGGCVPCHGFFGPPTIHVDGKVQVTMGVSWNYGYYGAARVPLNAALTIFDNTGTNGPSTDTNFAAMGADGIYGRCWGGANLYCHSDGRGGAPRINPAGWGGVQAAAKDCSYCHGGGRTSSSPIATGSHLKHIQGNMACGKCHGGTMGLAADNVITVYDNHVNTVKDVLFPDGGSYDGNPASPTYGTCSNT